MRPLLCLLIVLLAGACSNSVASLRYRPTYEPVPAPAATVSTVVSTDERSEAPRRLATIMGGFGNPLKTLDTAKPVKNEVVDAFLGGLRQRGLLAAGEAPFRLSITVRRFDADMIIGRTARIDLTMDVLGPNGAPIYRDSIIDSQSETKFFQTGIFAEIGDLQSMAAALLSRTVDRLLDKPAFRAAVDLPGT